MEQNTGCEPLLALATPQIYRRNLFRVLSISVGATPKDVQRQHNRRKMQSRLGIASSNGSNGPLGLQPMPGEEEIRGAMERLNRPVDRFLDEIFWFWPITDAPVDPALEALDLLQIERASEIWEAYPKNSGQGQIAIHNLAVLDHLIALDCEIQVSSENASTSHEGDLADRWLRAFARWKEVFEGEEFWDVVTERVRSLNDIELTTGFVRRVRGTLPNALLLINAKIAVSAAERGVSAIAQRHVDLIQATRYADGLADAAIRESLNPIRSRIKSAVDNARDRWTSTRHRANQHVRELHDHAKALLAAVDLILPADNLVRGGLHDMVAEAMLAGQIAFGNQTNDWSESIKLLEMAQRIAGGEAARARLSENLQILHRNAESGNDWCAANYWDLPYDTIAELERARAKAKSGDYDGALKMLVLLDPSIGKPLRRCVSYCLASKAIRVSNEALTEFNVEPAIIRTIMERLRGQSQSELTLTLMRRPDPHSPSFMNPPCLCCGKTSYTSWTNFTYRNMPLFMCSSCNSRHDKEVEQQKSTLRKHLGTALEYLLLAEEVDAGDLGVRRNLDTLKQTARDIKCSIPTTTKLKETLGAERYRGTRLVLDPDPTDGACYFCAGNVGTSIVPDASCRISVLMYGELKPSDLLFQKGTEYRYSDVIVPRCRRCRDEHRELPSRLERWQQTRSEAAVDEHFPEIIEAIRSAARGEGDTHARVEAAQREVQTAEAALKQASSIGNQCDRCSSTAYESYLCRQCDRSVFQLSWTSMVAVAAVTLLTASAVFLLYSELGLLSPLGQFMESATHAQVRGYLSLVAGGVIPVALGLTLWVLLKRRQVHRRRELAHRRSEDVAQHRGLAITQTEGWLALASSTLREAQRATQEAARAVENGKVALSSAKHQAVADFEKLHPQPVLSKGVKPEHTYIDFHRICQLRERGWRFGRVTDDASATGGGQPRAEGLVGREPRVPSDTSGNNLTQ